MEKWLIIFFIGIFVATMLYLYNNYQYVQEEKEQSEQNEYIISQIDNLSAERDEENLKQNKILLDNITHLVTDNGELIKAIIEDQNISITFDNDNDTFHHPNASGTISGIGKPVIIQ